jgi:hypothetical protein
MRVSRWLASSPSTTSLRMLSIWKTRTGNGYKMSMRIGNTVYSCVGSGPASTFIDWSINKEFPARLENNNKTMLVKSPNGQVVQLTVKGKKAAK